KNRYLCEVLCRRGSWKTTPIEWALEAARSEITFPRGGQTRSNRLWREQPLGDPENQWPYPWRASRSRFHALPQAWRHSSPRGAHLFATQSTYRQLRCNEQNRISAGRLPLHRAAQREPCEEPGFPISTPKSGTLR